MLKRLVLNNKGQALLIIVLVMVVALTVTLSVISRAVVNLRTTQEQVDSQKALAAAEAGVEQAIQNIAGAAPSGSFTNSQYTTTINPVQGASFLINGGVAVEQDKGAYIWLSPYTGDNTQWNVKWPTSGTATLNIFWGDTTGDSNNAAMEIAVISGANVASANITRYAVDPDSTRSSSNGFTGIPNGSNPTTARGTFTPANTGKTFRYQTSISISNGMLVRVIPVYKDAFMAVTSTTALPLQGRIVEARGCVPSCSSNSPTTRKVTVFQGFPELPADFFPYSLLIPSY
jgi:Tfp pilus assembly protein PilX